LVRELVSMLNNFRRWKMQSRITNPSESRVFRIVLTSLLWAQTFDGGISLTCAWFARDVYVICTWCVRDVHVMCTWCVRGVCTRFAGQDIWSIPFWQSGSTWQNLRYSTTQSAFSNSQFLELCYQFPSLLTKLSL
jgi:hypothetical protein